MGKYKQETVTIAVGEVIGENKFLAGLNSVAGQQELVSNAPFRYTVGVQGAEYKEYKVTSINQKLAVGDRATVMIRAGGKAELMFDAIMYNRPAVVLSDSLVVGGQPANELRDIPLIGKKAFGGSKKRRKTLLKGGAGKATPALVLKREFKGAVQSLGKIAILCKLLVLVQTDGGYFLTHASGNFSFNGKDAAPFYQRGAGTAVGEIVDFLYDPEDPSANAVRVPEECV
jgi:hypothetical protein